MNSNVNVHLDCWSIKIFALLGVLSALIIILWGFCPMVLLSISAFLCPHTWSHDENVDCSHLYHVITWTEMLTYTLIVGVLKYFLFLGFCLLWFLSFGAFVLWCFCPMVLLSISAFLCPPTWSHDGNVDCQHLHHVISWTEMGLYKLIVLVLKYFLFWGYVSFDFSPLGLLSYGAFVHFAFSLSAHVIAWRECWLSTPVSCDHMNRNVTVHLDCWSIKIFPLFGVLSSLIFILWGFCPMVLLSI